MIIKIESNSESQYKILKQISRTEELSHPSIGSVGQSVGPLKSKLNPESQSKRTSNQKQTKF